MTNTVRANIAAAISKIGVTTAKPPSTNNVTAILHEYFVAKNIKSLAEAREEQAKKDMLALAKDTGEQIDSVTPGDSVALFSDNPDYTMTLRVNKAPEKIDHQLFVTNLIKAGVKKDVIDKAEIAATTRGTPAKVFTIVPTEG